MGTSEKKYKVTFHRTYEVPEQMVLNRIKDFSPDTKISKKDVAEEIARNWMDDEMPEFIDNSSDFVSATVEIL